MTITPPSALEANEISLEANAVWMACARSCHPGRQRFSITLPVGEAPHCDPANRFAFAKADSQRPRALVDWEVKALTTSDESPIRLRLVPPRAWQGEAGSLYFFSADGQVSSDQPQVVESGEDGSLVMMLQRSDLSLKGNSALVGLLSSNTTRGSICAAY